MSLWGLIPIQEVLFHTYIKVSMFSSYSFSVSGFTFGSLIHLELGSFFVQGDGYRSHFILLRVDNPVFTTSFIENVFFSLEYVFGIFDFMTLRCKTSVCLLVHLSKRNFFKVFFHPT